MMSFFESVVVGLICISIVFIVLAALFTMISILSKLLGTAAGKKGTGMNTVPVSSAADEIIAANASLQTVNAQTAAAAASSAQAQADGVKLNNVDERTAAMIMAIVSHETKIPLNELVFRSISALD